MKYIKLVWNWLVYSSKNSDKVSATMHGSTLFIVATALANALQIDGFADVANSSVALVVVLSQLAGAIYALLGALRKVKRTLGGTNAVLNDRLLS